MTLATHAHHDRRALDGAVTPGYSADRAAVIEMLDRALATELVCALRYRRHHAMATGLRARPVAQEFLEHAVQESAHAERLAERIVQLGAAPDFDPASLLERSHASYDASLGLRDMIVADLVAERAAVEEYRRIIRIVGNDDPTTRRLLEDILAEEEHHADELAGLLEDEDGGLAREPAHSDPFESPTRRRTRPPRREVSPETRRDVEGPVI